MELSVAKRPPSSSCKLELARFSTLLQIQDRAKCCKGIEVHKGTPHKENVYWKGGHCTYFHDGGTIGVGKKHILGEEDTAHSLLMGQTIGRGHRTALKDQDTHQIPASYVASLTSIFVVGKKDILVGGDTAHTVLMEQTRGGGHRTTLKGQDTHQISAF